MELRSKEIIHHSHHIYVVSMSAMLVLFTIENICMILMNDTVLEQCFSKICVSNIDARNKINQVLCGEF
jgi:hypothetical protein